MGQGCKVSEDLLQGFYLGEFLVEPLKGQVTARTGAGHLPPKAIEVLLCLAKSSGELVTRETLLECARGEGHGSTESRRQRNSPKNRGRTEVIHRNTKQRNRGRTEVIQNLGSTPIIL